MGSIDDIMQLCRLCLVKDQVNIPIFDETSDIRKTFLKINSCLPVKVSRDDNLPKKICDGCSYKLDMLYVFRNTSVDSEKQLISWLNQAGLTSLSQAVKDGAKPEIMVKQETFETNDSRIEENPDDAGDIGLEAQHPEMGVDAHSYIMQQQKLPYQQDFAFGEPSGSTAGLLSEEPAPKRAKRAASVKKHVPLETEEDELVEAAMQITKAEEEDSDDIDQPEYVEAPSTSADDQPGPSGVGKGTIEAPPLEGELRYCCKICFKSFTKVYLLTQHRLVHMPGRFMCDVCSRVFKTGATLRRHVRAVHENQRTHQCSYCDYAATTSDILQRHVIGLHTKKYPYTCEVCGLGYLSPGRLDTHYKVQHEGHRFTCEFCDKTFKQRDGLKAHLPSHDAYLDNPNVEVKVREVKRRKPHTKKRYECEICSKILFYYANFKSHMKKHAGEQDTFMCDVCGKVVCSKLSLNNHKKIHTGEKEFVCEICGRNFNKKAILVNHIRVHTKEKPYQCPHCERSFAQKSTLNIHVRYHTGDMPYQCDICSKKFVRKSLLTYHKCKGA